jgi:hypothetical protein
MMKVICQEYFEVMQPPTPYTTWTTELREVREKVSMRLVDSRTSLTVIIQQIRIFYINDRHAHGRPGANIPVAAGEGTGRQGSTRRLTRASLGLARKRGDRALREKCRQDMQAELDDTVKRMEAVHV